MKLRSLYPLFLIMVLSPFIYGCHKSGSAAPDFTYSGTQNVGYPISFHTNVVAGTVVWQFGDNSTSASLSPVHTYTASDSFKVTLTINGDALHAITKTIWIAPPFIFTYTGIPCINDTLSFVSNAPSGSAFHWDFGDATSSTVATPNHTYATAGTYTVTLTLNNDNAQPVQQTIQILPNPMYTSLISGTRNWHHSEIVYLVGVPDTVIYHDTSFAVSPINPITVLFGADTLAYTITTGDTLEFYRFTDHGSANPEHDHLYFNHTANTVTFTYDYHISAAGSYVETYTSY